MKGKTIISAIVMVAGGICIATQAASCLNVAFNYFYQRNRVKKQVPTWRTPEENKIIDAYHEAKKAVNDLHAKEALSSVNVPIDTNSIDASTFSDISKKAEEAFNTLKENSIEGYVSDKDFKEAFKNISDTDKTVAEIIGKAKADVIINNRTPEDHALIKKFNDLMEKRADLIAKERGYIPKFFESLGHFACQCRDKGIQPFITYIMLTGPGYFGMVLGFKYVVKIATLVHDVYNS